MEPIRTLIVDDEEIARRGLATLVSEHPEFTVAGLCANGREAIERLLEERSDLVLLDVQMPGLSGFDVLARIPADRLPVVIFVTAFDEYAVRAFEVRALDYILKPVSRERFDAALLRAKERLKDRRLAEYGTTLLSAVEELRAEPAVRRGGGPSSQPYPERILVKGDKGIQFFEVDEIDWIEGADYYVILHSGQRSALYRESLKRLEETLDPGRFFRVHTSAIVNLKRAVEIRRGYRGDYEVVLATGQKLRVSRRRKKELLELGARR